MLSLPLNRGLADFQGASQTRRPIALTTRQHPLPPPSRPRRPSLWALLLLPSRLPQSWHQRLHQQRPLKRHRQPQLQQWLRLRLPQALQDRHRHRSSRQEAALLLPLGLRHLHQCPQGQFGIIRKKDFYRILTRPGSKQIDGREQQQQQQQQQQ